MKLGFFTNFLCGSVGAGVLRNALKIRIQCGYRCALKNSRCQCTLANAADPEVGGWPI